MNTLIAGTVAQASPMLPKVNVNDTIAAKVDASGNLQVRRGGSQNPADVIGTGTGNALAQFVTLKGAAGRLVWLRITNAGAADQWYGVYDAADPVTAGSVNLVDMIRVPKNDSREVAYEFEFKNGITAGGTGTALPTTVASLNGATAAEDSMYVAKVD